MFPNIYSQVLCELYTHLYVAHSLSTSALHLPVSSTSPTLTHAPIVIPDADPPLNASEPDAAPPAISLKIESAKKVVNSTDEIKASESNRKRKAEMLGKGSVKIVTTKIATKKPKGPPWKVEESVQILQFLKDKNLDYSPRLKRSIDGHLSSIKISDGDKSSSRSLSAIRNKLCLIFKECSHSFLHMRRTIEKFRNDDTENAKEIIDKLATTGVTATDRFVELYLKAFPRD